MNQSVSRMTVILLLTIVGFLLTSLAGLATTRALVSSQCDTAAHQAAQEFNVPSEILLALTRTETGRPMGGQSLPWPWSINASGKSHFFETKKAAISYIRNSFDGTAAHLDIGCFQLNVKWHGAKFTSLSQMFSPKENARYAATFLDQLYREFGSWRDAVGAYHSRTPEFANAYKGRFDTHLAQIDTEPTSPQKSKTSPMRDGLFNVHRAGKSVGSITRTLGSLLPQRLMTSSAKRLY